MLVTVLQVDSSQYLFVDTLHFLSTNESALCQKFSFLDSGNLKKTFLVALPACIDITDVRRLKVRRGVNFNWVIA